MYEDASSSRPADSSYASSIGADGDSDEEMDWEEIAVPAVATTSTNDFNGLSEEPLLPPESASEAGKAGNIEITIRKANKGVDPKRK